MKLLLHLLVFALTLTVSALAAASDPAVAALQVGQPVPAATVRTERDSAVDLRTAIAGQPTVLIFYRGGWCPFCTRHLTALAETEAELRAAGFQLLALSPDRPAKLRARPSHQKLPYTLLSDSGMTAAQAFGIAFRVEDALVSRYKQTHGIDLEADSGQTHHLLPHPAVFIVDRTGHVRYAHVNPDYKVRLTPAEIIAAARAALVPPK